MKVVVYFSRSSILPGRCSTVECDRVSPCGAVLNFFDTPGSKRPSRAIALTEIAQWEIVKEVKMDSKIEQYLQENYGNLQQFYAGYSVTAHAGQALRSSLCGPDVFRLQKSGKLNGLLGEREFDSPLIVETLEWLKEDAVNYPEDHPLWNTRKNR